MSWSSYLPNLCEDLRIVGLRMKAGFFHQVGLHSLFDSVDDLYETAPALWPRPPHHHLPSEIALSKISNHKSSIKSHSVQQPCWTNPRLLRKISYGNVSTNMFIYLQIFLSLTMAWGECVKESTAIDMESHNKHKSLFHLNIPPYFLASVSCTPDRYGPNFRISFPSKNVVAMNAKHRRNILQQKDLCIIINTK